MMTEFYRSREIKAVRKARRCDECRHMIEVGTPAIDYAQKFDGEMYSGTVHADCKRWADRVIVADSYDDGRPFLCDADPDEEEINVGWLRANPTPPDLYARLPPRWQRVVDEIQGPPMTADTGAAPADGGA